MQVIKGYDFSAYNFGRLSVLAFESTEDLARMARVLNHLVELNNNAGDGTGYTRIVCGNKENKDHSPVYKDELKDAIAFGDIFIDGRTRNIPVFDVSKV